MKRKKVYVIFNGENAGIYDSWEECEYRICYRRLRFKGFENVQNAIDAIRRDMDLEDKYVVYKNLEETYCDNISNLIDELRGW